MDIVRLGTCSKRKVGATDLQRQQQGTSARAGDKAMGTIRALVVGAGGIADAWFPPLAEEKVEVVAVVDLVKERAEQRIAKYKLKALASDNLDKVLREAKADFAVDLTLPEAHGQVTCKCLRAGLAVVSEKPMASSMAEARKMVRTSEAMGKIGRAHV